MQIKNHLIGTSKFRATLSVVLLLRQCGGSLTSSEMAQQMNVHAAYLRKIISKLRNAGIVEAKEGYDGGYKLRLPEWEISLADVYEAVREEKKSQTDTMCNWTKTLNGSLEDVMIEIDKCTITCLKEYSVTDMANRLSDSI